jgi:hypothetical protein
MTLQEFKHLLRWNSLKLLLLPLVTAITIYFLAGFKEKMYTSATTIFTGTASSYRITGDNNANTKVSPDVVFGNFSAIINARETREEIGLNLLATHLMLKTPNPSIINPFNSINLKN